MDHRKEKRVRSGDFDELVEDGRSENGRKARKKEKDVVSNDQTGRGRGRGRRKFDDGEVSKRSIQRDMSTPDKSCIKVAQAFVAPESVEECRRLAQEFRRLPRDHRSKEDKLELKKIVLHAASSAIREHKRSTAKLHDAVMLTKKKKRGMFL